MRPCMPYWRELYLEKKGGSIDPMTAQAYEYFKKVKGERDELKGNGETGISGSQR